MLNCFSAKQVNDGRFLQILLLLHCQFYSMSLPCTCMCAMYVAVKICHINFCHSQHHRSSLPKCNDQELKRFRPFVTVSHGTLEKSIRAVFVCHLQQKGVLQKKKCDRSDDVTCSAVTLIAWKTSSAGDSFGGCRALFKDRGVAGWRRCTPRSNYRVDCVVRDNELGLIVLFKQSRFKFKEEWRAEASMELYIEVQVR